MTSSEQHILIYDGTFDGFLTCVFYVYEQKIAVVEIQKEHEAQPSLFGSVQTITSSSEMADRVWKGIKAKTSATGSLRIYYAFLSEAPHIENLLLGYIQTGFKSKVFIDTNFSDDTVLKTAQIAKSVGREKHRMEAFVRFKLTKDGIYFANIEPDFDVLPLISKHFERRYADQKWIIYDLKRRYGLFYDLEKVEIIQLALPDNFDASGTSAEFFAVEELEFQTLWQDYFESTNIKSRKNIQLHVRHVPKRYWKYLSEKLR